jgi:hypothetical protein
MDGIGVVPVVGEIIELILVADNIIKSMLAFTNASVEVTEISSLLISNLIRIYKQNAKEVESSHGRIHSSFDKFFNIGTSTQSTPSTSSNDNQKGGKKKTKSKTKRYYKKKL